MENSLNEHTLQNIGRSVLDYLRDTSGILFKFFIGIILSYIFVIDRKSVAAFLSSMKSGSFGFIYRECAYIGEKLTHGFGKIFKAQSIIALVNAVLTILGLIIIGHSFGYGGFPYIFTLALIVFIFGFIPVFGMFLSGLPIVIIGYGFGGMNMVIAIVAMIAIIHAIEAYILNPKIVSSYVHFPIFITFVSLLIAEHMLGFVGLLIGIPILSVILSLLKDLDVYIASLKKQLHASHTHTEHR